MPSLGFSREVIDWYKSYLSSRKFHVNVHDKFSASADLWCGVPQGSILEPLLFLLYINDMPEAVDRDLFLYTDVHVCCFSIKIHPSLTVWNPCISRQRCLVWITTTPWCIGVKVENLYISWRNQFSKTFRQLTVNQFHSFQKSQAEWFRNVFAKFEQHELQRWSRKFPLPPF